MQSYRSGLCSDCKITAIYNDQVRLLQPKLIYSTTGETKSYRGTERSEILDLSFKAARYVHAACEEKDDRQMALHVACNQGVVMSIGTSEWRSWLTQYPDIATARGLGDCRDKYGVASPFVVNRDDFFHGKVIQIDVTEFFADDAEFSDEDGAALLADATIQYDKGRTRFGVDEFCEFVDWTLVKKAAGQASMLSFVRKHKLSEHMKSKGFPYRPPVAYPNLHALRCKCK